MPDAPSSLLLNILDLDALSRDPSLVRPGLPDGSPLYTTMLRRSMPPDARGIDGAWGGPAAEDIQAVRDWIDSLPERPAALARARERHVDLHAADASAPVPAQHQTEKEPQQLDLAIWSGKPAYSKGELLTLHARSNTDCHLTLIGLDREGRATVLFPNELEPDNRLTAGQVLTVPGAGATYQFRLANEGRERVVGVCTVNAGLADGIEPDYERQRFTMLGDWRAFLFEAWSKDGAAAAPRGRQTRSARRRGKQREAMKVERPSPEHHARTAITFEVR